MVKLLRYIDWSELSGLLVGAVIAVVVCVSVFILVSKLQQDGVLGKREYNLYCDLVTGQGLRKGTNVQINGVDIGNVEEISLTESGLVRLKLILDVKYKRWITNKSIVYATRDQNIISERVVNIDISQVGNEVLSDGDYLIAGTAQDIETVLKTANELIDRIGKLVVAADSLLKIVVDTNTSIGALLGSRILYNQLDYATRKLNGLLVDADGVVFRIDDVFKTLNGGIPKASAFADTITTSFTGLVGNLNDLTNRASVLMNSLDTTLRDVGNMVNSLNTVMGTTGNIISDGSQTLNKADDFIGGLSKSWFLRGNIPKKDSIPLLEDTW
ncbi:MAG: MlaD family protein [Fibromonadaceae bacterium]|jgi:phospholipid/cholesterol/gamma-HCH transport system substrate-binding protein|nr:MlaD family protein [Fibromonadaceae bacterium]